MVNFAISDAFKTTYPGAAIGVLAMRRVANPARHATLDERKTELEDALRGRFAGYDRAAFKALPTIQAYTAFYKRFRKSYHVQLQLESVVLKGKSIPSVAALVECMFMAELKNMLLTAGHDLGLLHMPVTADVADGSESYTRINGQEQVLKAGDMMISDAQGVLSSVIYGPDRRTQINAETEQVLFTVYAPQGIERQAVHSHLQDIQSYVLLVAQQAETIRLEAFGDD
jgi:DNA/RNA-binding domain of Phe-tRNA-synthetase-like protein